MENTLLLLELTRKVLALSVLSVRIRQRGHQAVVYVRPTSTRMVSIQDVSHALLFPLPSRAQDSTSVCATLDTRRYGEKTCCGSCVASATLECTRCQGGLLGAHRAAQDNMDLLIRLCPILHHALHALPEHSPPMKANPSAQTAARGIFKGYQDNRSATHAPPGRSQILWLRRIVPYVSLDHSVVNRRALIVPCAFRARTLTSQTRRDVNCASQANIWTPILVQRVIPVQ